jgi:hypothetical protein
MIKRLESVVTRVDVDLPERVARPQVVDAGSVITFISRARTGVP